MRSWLAVIAEPPNRTNPYPRPEQPNVAEVAKTSSSFARWEVSANFRSLNLRKEEEVLATSATLVFSKGNGFSSCLDMPLLSLAEAC